MAIRREATGSRYIGTRLLLGRGAQVEALAVRTTMSLKTRTWISVETKILTRNRAGFDIVDGASFYEVGPSFE